MLGLRMGSIVAVIHRRLRSLRGEQGTGTPASATMWLTALIPPLGGSRTSPTTTATTRIDIEIRASKGMALEARSLGAVCVITPTHILAGTHSLQVPKFHAKCVVAQVVNLKGRRDGAAGLLIDPAMGQNLP
jgi:hypothetical protein